MGQCTTDLVCNTSQASGATCGIPKPSCHNGLINSVDSTNCWGPCLDPSDCWTVSDCDLCKSEQVCVEYYDNGTLARRHCVDVPPACQGQRNCACMAPAVCVGSGVTCSSSGSGLRCDYSN
jgi:hypothetical protein